MVSRLHPLAAFLLLVITGACTPAAAMQARSLSGAEAQRIRQGFAACMARKKGPYTENYCVCPDGSRELIRRVNGKTIPPCGGKFEFCAAFRHPCTAALTDHGMYIANIFSRDLYTWKDFPDHHDLVRGYVLEKYFIDTHPTHKLAELRGWGGLSGAESEAAALPTFMERYLALPTFTDARHFLLAYELQKRFFVHDDQGQIQRARVLAIQIFARDPGFKALRDATHNQISAALVPRLEAYRDAQPDPRTRALVDDLIGEVTKLTALDASVLATQIAAIEDAPTRTRLEALVPPPDAPAVLAIESLGGLMVQARSVVAAGVVPLADRRRAIDLDITAAAVIQAAGAALLAAGTPLTVRDHVRLLVALTDASYGTGLLTARERESARAVLESLLARPEHERATMLHALRRADRTVEWAQNGAVLAFAEVRPTWMLLLPETMLIGDDILRGSPLLLFGRVSAQLSDHVSGQRPIRHQLFGKEISTDIRALNPGLALGRLRVDPAEGTYARNEIVALPETPAELQPAAGILTQGEGNVVSHVQLLARALGVPNAVVGSEPYRRIAAHGGSEVFYIVTPAGRVYLKTASAMTDEDRAIVAEYRRNVTRTADGDLNTATGKLHIDRDRLDVETADVIDLVHVRRTDSGIRCGPKAAYLGELKHLFPDKVARGVVVPFGAYYDHYEHATVRVPAHLANAGLATPGQALPDFVAHAFAEFFDAMIPAGTPERALSSWIAPRLEIVQYSLRQAPLSDSLRTAIREALERQGLLRQDDPSQTVGCFVRSDTNVEDLDDFNGAGLNLTLFNLRSLEDVYAGIKEVWASPFSFRSFSWRQTLIDQPLWVLPSIVILESVASEKSGVLVTADVEAGTTGKMLIATSEGVGGAVDGTPAETLLWSPGGVELITMFKSPWRRLLQPDGGSVLVAATGDEYVLKEDELATLVETARSLDARLEPTVDAAGRPRPWDIEFGFAGGKLWLFQVRPFVGNDDLRNVPALAALDPPQRAAPGTVSLDEAVR